MDNAEEFRDKIIAERRRGALPERMSVQVAEVTGDVNLETGKGRVQRPLIVVKNGKPLLTDAHLTQLRKHELSWQDLVKQGVIEHLDAAEEENTLVAFTASDLTEAHTHMEVTPLAILGLCTSLVPFANYNQSARLNAGSKNQKQALGLYAANYLVRMDMDTNVLHEAQMPIVRSDMHIISDYASHPSGQNMIVAIMSYKGYNMEDAIIINKASLDRGLARNTYFRPSVAEELRYSGGLVDEVCIPDKDVKGYRSEKDYRYLEEDGIIYPEASVQEEDVIIGKTSPPRFLSGMDEYSLTSNIRRESSVSMPHGEKGKVDFVLLTENDEGNRMVQVRIRDQRVPEIGDKFTSRHGQKGVIGLIVPQSDMPFSVSGITPDIIFSPHGIPSRMTIAHLIELVGGKLGSLEGRYIDGTAFDAEDPDALRKALVSHGFRESGTEQ
ncbi:DNA-directed RNA polymerase subunit B, partial [Candidatus Woesearchaeota archaeon CG_4_10_14_0_2_um_filter_57_5]